jgi:hypothetical protein
MKRLQRVSGRLPQGRLRRIALGGRPCCIGAGMGLGRFTMFLFCGKDGLSYQRFVDRHWQPLAMHHRIASGPASGTKSS